VPRVQYGLINSNAALNCTANYTTPIIKWKYSNLSDLSESVISRVSIADEGHYICEVYLSTIDLTMHNPVQFIVIGKFSA
jgi:hypothetical protein